MDTSLSELFQPFDVIAFDCDSTLSGIEGIDILAQAAGVGPAVAASTEKAMSETGITPELFAERMNLVKPSLHQVVELGRDYFEHRVPDLLEIIEALTFLNKKIVVLSAGLNPAVKIFTNLLGIPEENVFAVDVFFNEEGEYLNFDREAPTAGKFGKRKIIETLKLHHPRILLVGDGMNDLEASEAVQRFVGFGGFHFRKNIAEACSFYIKECSFASLLFLALTESERMRLPAKFAKLIESGRSQLEGGVKS